MYSLRKMRLLAVAALVLLATPAVAQQEAQQWQKLMEEGVEAYRAKNYGKAERRFKNALKIARAMGSDQRTASAFTNLGITRSARGDYLAAERHFKSSLALLEKDATSNHRDVVLVLTELGKTYHQRIPGAMGRRLAITVTTQNTVVSTGPGFLPPGPPSGTIAEAQARLQETMRKAEAANFPRAEQSYRRAMQLEEQAGGAESPHLLQLLELLGDLYLTTRRFPEADASFQRGLRMSEQRDGVESLRAATFLTGLANSARRQQKYTDAEPLYTRALAIKEKLLGIQHADLIPALDGYARLLWQTDRKDEAKKIEVRIWEIQKQRK